ncbi:MAG TPA: response regulator [Burkholderiales bacterium]|nr:response regulator [Burkholderiales bacterium]
MHPANPAAALDHGKSSPGRLAPLRVYLVEDSALLCERMVELLTDPGRIEFAGQAETEGAAVAGISECRPDAVIVDIRLREGNGVNVLRSVAHKKMPGEPPTMIVLTNYAVPEYYAECIAMGADYFFDKSTEFHRVGEVLQDLAADRRNTTSE